jgi:hypothetical protein
LHEFLHANPVEKTAEEDELEHKKQQITADAERHYEEAMDLVRTFFLGQRESSIIPTP